MIAAIQEANDFKTLSLEQLFGSLINYERNDDVRERGKNRKEKRETALKPHHQGLR